ncbi:MAG: hypothetical protein SCALA701_19570 [Candidatus Scalindua sp.]|nr:hypothetical protein [Planctomycetota bacterium]RZV82432.1 MAG: hypothetical protein EX341_09685 [Candidatus Scalindua sp. SCAELEC01]GJQ59156.1 MAG: hypothetical protein SCALA701_19570 [Candidatus Scalindua sp.]
MKVKITAARNGVTIVVKEKETNDQLEVSLQMNSHEPCLLHWGISRSPSATWQAPPQSLWPAGTKAFDQKAVQTPFSPINSENRIVLKLDKSMKVATIHFVLFYPGSGQWDNNDGKNYSIKLQQVEEQTIPPHHLLQAEMEGKEVLLEKRFDLYEEYTLAVAVSKSNKNYRVMMATDISGPLLCHWGVAVNAPFEWLLPSASVQPTGTAVIDSRSVQTPFVLQNGLNRLNLPFSEEGAPIGITFVLKEAETGLWLKDKGRNFFIPINSSLQEGTGLLTSNFFSLAEEIIQAEMEKNSWTLMHRFTLCHDLLEKSNRDRDLFATLFVWLRYSALRQLDWQRNYNTQPRELSHAQDRLTLRLADMYINNSEDRDIIRLLFSTLGRGGEGQKIRDEILNIMHRHHIKEVSNHFMEEWHQKLHNNTTPDDVVICEAYLEFLRSDGDLSLFYDTLRNKGVTKERLENFERPIVTPPDFVHHLKEPLIHEFENYLKILKSIHSGTDLESAMNAAHYLLNDNTREHLDALFQQRFEVKMQLLDQVEKITMVRKELGELLRVESNQGRLRDMIYLDLALEETLRLIIEGNIQPEVDQDQLVDLIDRALENQCLSSESTELMQCFLHWKKLKGMERFSQDWSLHAKSVLDRIGRVIGAFSDDYYHLFQPKAEFLGSAFQADSWIVPLFSEEIIRGRLAFILSMLAHHLEPILRMYARLGNWQVISPGEASGKVEIVDTLRAIQGKSFCTPTVVVADKVMGDEEPPSGVCAIITPDAVDLVSHIAVRARNSHLLFATCYDNGSLEKLKSHRGHFLNLAVTASGDIMFEKSDNAITAEEPQIRVIIKELPRRPFSSYAISSNHFNDTMVGGKSNNLMRLQGVLPEWITLPDSVALPFGVFDEVLSLGVNRKVAEDYEKLLSKIEENPKKRLSEIRALLLKLQQPKELFEELLRVMNRSDLHQEEDEAWMCIKQVWASKWNERAYVSRKSRGIPHNNIDMAVLIQRVVPAEYAFVIHTHNPFTNDGNELYAEVVLGLGETLVSNYPGRALSFTKRKDGSEPNLLAYPSKGIALIGDGYIFRSDSNGEDLEGYAGAGLYDSVMLPQPKKLSLQYEEEPLLWNLSFRRDMLNAIAEIGMITEMATGSPQDIEGVYAKGKYYLVQTRPQV